MEKHCQMSWEKDEYGMNAEDTLLGALTEGMRKSVEEKLPYMSNLRKTDVTRLQKN